MEILYWFESIRTPLLTGIMSVITLLGEAEFFIVASLLVLWCIDKEEGYYMLSVGILGLEIQQWLKNIFCIPRPWVKDPSLQVVESAIEAAKGYSFPSGHTMTATGFWGAIAQFNKEKWIKIISVALLFLIGISRMYLGVHTIYDVSFSWITGLICVYIIYLIGVKNKKMITTLLFHVFVAILFVSYMEYRRVNVAVDPEITNALKNAYTSLGLSVGLVLSYYVDRKYLNYQTKAPLKSQIMKVIFGLIIMLGIYFLGDKLFMDLLNHEIGYALSYLLMTICAGILWPMTFGYFNK